jgi:hypothetical protein
MMHPGAWPEHFWPAVDHGTALLAAGYPQSLVRILSAAALSRGLIDAAAGYDHAVLVLVVVQQTFRR